MELLFCLQTLDGALQALLSQLDSAKVSNRCGQLLRLADRRRCHLILLECACGRVKARLDFERG